MATMSVSVTATRYVNFETLTTAIEIAATLAFAMSGLIESVRKRMDIVGVFSVTFVSAFAGGTLRDVLLDRRPFFWVQNQEYIWLVLVLTLIAPLLLRPRQQHLRNQLMELADACGLGLFAISGTSVAMVAGMPWIVAIMMGAITAAFGGVARDVLCNEIPKVFHDHSPYTLCTFIGSLLFLILHEYDVAPELSTGIGILTITGLRLLAVRYGLRIPAWPARR